VVESEVSTEASLAISWVELTEEEDHPRDLTSVILKALPMYGNEIDDSLANILVT
jgi:hypothetical protein